MKTYRWLVYALALGLPVSGMAQVSSPAKRLESLDLAARLLAPQENRASSLPADLVDLFSSSRASLRAKTSGRSSSSSDRETLLKIVEKVKPSGMLMMRGEPLLLFREKKLKVGDTLNIAFEGSEYVLVITGIESTSFKVSLNHEEITRPIKPAKVP
jgi:hypothetical protein